MSYISLSLFSLKVLLFSVCFRQTNIVWVVFVAGVAGLKVIEAKFYQDMKCMCLFNFNSYQHAVSLFSYLSLPSFPFLSFLFLFLSLSLSFLPLNFTAGYWSPWISYPLSILTSLLRNLPSLTMKLWPYIFVVFSFLTFVFKNGSIVVGDKSHHQASFHLPQLLYFTVFSCAMASPYFLFNPRLMAGFVKVMLTRKRWIGAFILLLGMTALAVHHYTYV